MSQESNGCAICGGEHPTGLCETAAGQRTDGKALDSARRGLGIGDRLGGYRVTELLGAGASAQVFMGAHVVLGAQVAVKAMRPELHDDPELIRRFIGEARATNMVRHEHIVEVLDIGEFEGWQQYSVMELLRGQTLRAALNGNPWRLEDATVILTQVCEGLGAAHANGVVHRDLKPDNIYLTTRSERTHVKLVDFGSARRANLAEGEARTTVGTVLGTANYMAPEQAMGREVDGRADIYSLGVIMFQMATGRLPFSAKNAAQMLTNVATKEAPPPSSFKQDVDRAWESIIVRCLAKAPADRFATAADLGRAIVRTHRPSRAPAQDDFSEGQKTEIVHVDSPPVSSPPPLRYTTSFAVRVGSESGVFAESMVVTNISDGGMFLATQRELPPVFSRVSVRVPTPEGPVDFAGEVARISDGTDGPRGFAIRFDPLDSLRSSALRGLLARAVPVGHTSPGEDAEVARLLARFASIAEADHYALLGLSPHHGARQVGEAGRRLAETTDPRRFPDMSERQRDLLLALQRRLAEAEEVLIDPARRAQYDAARGNFIGVAQCLRDGLAVETLSNLRRAFLADHPNVETAIRPYLGAAKASEAKGDVESAARTIAKALELDALNIGLQRLYWDLRRQARAKPT
jgi:eukaryotic-like serine/threonine-protein kinase